MEVSIVPWDARVAWFEGIPVDTTKGATKYSFYDWGSAARYEEFRKGFGKNDLKRAILQEVRELAL